MATTTPTPDMLVMLFLTTLFTVGTGNSSNSTQNTTEFKLSEESLLYVIIASVAGGCIFLSMIFVFVYAVIRRPVVKYPAKDASKEIQPTYRKATSTKLSGPEGNTRQIFDKKRYVDAEIHKNVHNKPTKELSNPPKNNNEGAAIEWLDSAENEDELWSENSIYGRFSNKTYR